MKRGPIVALVVLAAAIAAVVALGSREHGMGNLLSSRAAVADAATTPPLPPTQLAALPGRVLANGTAPLAVALSAPVSPSSPPPTLDPNDRGHMEHRRRRRGLHARLDAATVLTLRADGLGAHELHRPRAARTQTDDRTARRVPPTRRLQQALARLGYLPAKLHPRYDRAHRSRARDAP